MRTTFKSNVEALKKIVNRFDSEGNRQKVSIMKWLSENKMPLTKLLVSYFEALLFIRAFPPDKKTFKIAEHEIVRITAYLKKQPLKAMEVFTNSGIPFTKYQACYSHDCTRWLSTHSDCTIHITSIEDVLFDLNVVLKVTLPSVERSETTSAISDMELLNELMPKKELQLPYLLNELSRFDDQPYVKDHFYEGLGIQTDILPKNKFFSKAYNQIEIPEMFYHNDSIKHFNARDILDSKLPAVASLTEVQRSRTVRVIKNSMAITDRETDPATFMKEESLRLFHLERGLSVAIYAMEPQRQLPLESYFGYTLFKNGYPAAYAGGWVFGSRSDFGLNIYDHFRGGESGYMVCQVLRVYRQLFNVNYFQVEASQFGLDSPEGIATGVFWFYYKLGFRPIDHTLRKLAADEYKKIRSRKGYRTPERILIKFTESNISLNLGKGVPLGVYDITNKIKQMIIRKHLGNSRQAELKSIEMFLSKTKLKNAFNKDEYEVLKEVALWAAAIKVTEIEKLKLMIQMIKLKPADEYQYQQVVRLYFAK